MALDILGLMSEDPARPLRADAARNSAKILHAAREVYAISGPDAQLEEIAKHAGVGIATLYRRFPNKEELVRAAFEQSVAELITPAIERALAEADPLRGLTALLEATMEHWSREYPTMAAARKAGVLGVEMSVHYFNALTELMVRGQRAGCVRADLEPDDIKRIVVMLLGVLPTLRPGDEGWRRYVALAVDGISTIEPKPPLPAAGPLIEA